LPVAYAEFLQQRLRFLRIAGVELSSAESITSNVRLANAIVRLDALHAEMEAAAKSNRDHQA
jgi:hypothetical protein